MVSISQVLRIVAGVLVIAPLSYDTVGASPALPQGLGLVLVGLIGGFVMRSWWSPLLVLVTLGVTSWLWRRIECADCPAGEDGGVPLVIEVFIVIGILAVPVLSAAAGTYAAKAVARTHDSPLLIGLALPVGLSLLAFWLHDSNRVELENLPLLALAAGLLATGFLTGVLIRRWWSVAYVAIMGVPWPFEVDSSYYEGPLSRMVIAVLVWGMLPLAIGAAIGTLVGRSGENGATRLVQGSSES